MDILNFSTLMSLFLGIGLAAAAGFRVFLPLFALSIAAHFGMDHLSIGEQFAWVGSWPAIITLGVATLVEILAYYIPLVDNLLDSIAIPLAGVAGTFLVASTMVDMNEVAMWALAIIAGGGTAASISGGTAAARATSSTTTAGTGNFLVNTGETATASILSATALIWAPLAFVLVLIILFVLVRLYNKFKRLKSSFGEG